ncbi:DUF4178 domain-containing protein [Nafulsella turpanensis]|uniref:DUF4178 domain-containing protein n=1 Tax=Nafulsella turpanensis TaxID=1265690 RepID=UPI00034C6763|nr:DUF4178 domain-containing protein [Nafulsella turpanensis]
MGFLDGLFGKKRRKEEEVDPLNISLLKLQKGYILDYDLASWEVQEVYNYDWGDNFFSREYKISNGKDVRYLHIEDDDELELVLSEKVRPATIDPDLPDYIGKHGHPPKKIHYKGTHYYFESESPGYFNEEGKEDQWVEHISWTYYDEDEKYTLGIEQWGEREFEASVGKILKEFEISNIIPAGK